MRIFFLVSCYSVTEIVKGFLEIGFGGLNNCTFHIFIDSHLLRLTLSKSQANGTTVARLNRP